MPFFQADKSVVIVFSDGLENASGISANEVVLKARSNKTVVHAIGFDLMGRPLLADLCEKTGGKYYPAEGPDNLAAEFARLGGQFSQYYSVKAACQDVKLPANVKVPVDTTIATLEDPQTKGLFPWNDVAFGYRSSPKATHHSETRVSQQHKHIKF